MGVHEKHPRPGEAAAVAYVDPTVQHRKLTESLDALLQMLSLCESIGSKLIAPA
jgi:hypothetical protein